VHDAKQKQKRGFAGINLLAYRYQDSDPEVLMDQVISSVEIPVIVAGSINSLERVRRVVKAGAYAFTIGTAIFDRRIVPSDRLEDQVRAVVETCTKL